MDFHVKEGGIARPRDQAKQMLAVIKEERDRYPQAFDANAAGENDIGGVLADGRMERQIEWRSS